MSLKAVCCLLFTLLLAHSLLAQDKRQPTPLTVTATATTEQVRFTAPTSVVQMHLEVYNETALKLFDFELKGGNVLDWHLQNGQAERLSPGTYLCVVTVKTRSGKLTQKLGTVKLAAERVGVEPWQPAQLNAQQAQAIGPLEEDAALTVLPEAEPQTGTLLAHNGKEGQIIRGEGALSFRLGDFFGGKDQEQMRLSAEGKLGLGVSEPQAKLDVAGTIRTSEGIVFPDGTVQTTAYVASGRSLSERVGLQRDAQGRRSTEAGKPGGAQQQVRLAPNGTANRLTKFAFDGEGLVDTQLSESNGALLVGNAGAIGNIQIFGPANADVFAGMGPDVVNGPAFNYGYAGSSFGRSAGFFNVRPDASAVAPNPSLRFLTANQQRMIITNTGNVGIGTTAPQALLNVNGQLRWGGVTSNYIRSDQDAIGVFFEQAGSTAGRSVIRLQASKSSDFTNYSQFFIDPYNGFSFTTLGSGNGNVGIGTNAPLARLHIANASASGSGLMVEAAEGDRAALYYSTDVGAVFDSFRPSDSRRLPILLQPNGGNVGIGTTSPAAKLEVKDGNLAITNGTIKITGAGANTPTAVFVHVVTEASHTCSAGQTIIDNPYTNNDPNAILIITQSPATVNPFAPIADGEFILRYGDQNIGCVLFGGLNRWMIYSTSTIPIGARFNVMVIKP